MKFLICIDDVFREELEGVANALGTNGQDISAFDRNIYRSFDERQPDFVLFSPATYQNQEIQRFIQEKHPNHCVVDSENISFSDGFVLNLPSFANTIKYKPALPSKSLESDIAIIFDGRNGEFVHDLYHNLHKQHKVKIAGAFINCPGYIGISPQQDWVKLAKSARLTVATNKIINNSLLYNNILSVYNKPHPEELLKLEKIERDRLVLSEKKQIITENKLGQLLLEKFSNFNR